MSHTFCPRSITLTWRTPTASSWDVNWSQGSLTQSLIVLTQSWSLTAWWGLLMITCSWRQTKITQCYLSRRCTNCQKSAILSSIWKNWRLTFSWICRKSGVYEIHLTITKMLKRLYWIGSESASIWRHCVWCPTLIVRRKPFYALWTLICKHHSLSYGLKRNWNRKYNYLITNA